MEDKRATMQYFFFLIKITTSQTYYILLHLKMPRNFSIRDFA